MANKLIELDNFSAPPHAKHVFAKKDGDKVTIHLLDQFYNNQGSMSFTLDNAKVLVKELMDELYGEVR